MPTILQPANAFPGMPFPQHIGGDVARNLIAANSDNLNAGSFQQPQTAFTFACWINPASVVSSQIIAAVYNVTTRSYFQCAIINPGVLFSRIQQDGQIDTTYIQRNSNSNAVSAAAWQHVAMTWSGGTTDAAIKSYVNGIQVDTTNAGAGSFTAPYSGAAVDFTIGKQGGASPLFFGGPIADICTWNIALSGAQIAALATPARASTVAPSSIASYWPIFGGSPEADQSGNGHNAVVTGTTVVVGPPGLAPVRFPSVQSYLYPGAVLPNPNPPPPSVLSIANAFPNLAFPQHGLPAIWNPATKTANITLSSGNLTAANTGTSEEHTFSTLNSAGKFYYEVVINLNAAGSNTVGIGAANSTFISSPISYLGSDINGIGYYNSTGQVIRNTTVLGTLLTFTAGDNIGVAVDTINGKIWFRKNGGSWDNTTDDPATNTGGFTATALNFAGTSLRVASGSQVSAQFLSTSWTYAAPSGFLPLGAVLSQVQSFLYPGAVQPQVKVAAAAFLAAWARGANRPVLGVGHV